MEETNEECDEPLEPSHVLKEKQTKEDTNESIQTTSNIKIPRNRDQRLSTDENIVSTSEGSPSTSDMSPDGKRLKPKAGDTTPSALCFGGGSLSYAIPPSPPKFVSLEEIMKAANGVENMVLAHRITVDNDFKLEKTEPIDNSLEKTVKDVMHRAFWDILSSQLNESPPNYKQAMVLISEIKETLLSLLLPQHIRLKQEIEEIVDLDLIRQQAENGILDFQRYAQYVLSVCARLCAPARDDTIRELTQTNEVVPLFRGIFDLLDVMKLDMANFHIQQMRPYLQLKSIEYERQKFKELIESQSKFSSVDSLQYTKQWIKTTVQSIDLSNETNSTTILNKILDNAFLQLLTADDSTQLNTYPETLLLDVIRINTIKAKVLKLTLIGSVFLVTYATLGPSFQGLQVFKDKLKDQLMVLISDKSLDLKPEELKSQMTSVSLQIIKEAKICAEKHGLTQIDDTKEQTLENQIKDIYCSDNRLRKVVERRILEFVERVISSPTAVPMQIPVGLSPVKEELTQIAGQFVRIVVHNKAVFTEYYSDIINDLISGVNTSVSDTSKRVGCADRCSMENTGQRI